MNFENYADRILSFNDHENLDSCQIKRLEQQRFQVVNGKISMVKAIKSKLAQLNDKHFCLSDGIVSLPFSQPLLKNLIHYKERQGKKLKEFILIEKNKLLKLE